MSEETPTTETVETDPIDPTEPTENLNSPEQSPEPEEFDAERARALIRKLREEARAATKAIKERDALQAEKRAADEAKLSEQERLTKRAADLERELEQQRKSTRDLTNRYEVQRQASKLNIIDPEAAEKLIDWGQVEYDDAGKPTNLADVLADLVEAKPYLKATKLAQGQRQPAGNPTNPATRTPAPGSRRYTTADITSRAFYLANKEDINLAIREGRIDD